MSGSGRQELTAEVAASADAEGRLQEVLTRQQQPPGPSLRQYASVRIALPSALGCVPLHEASAVGRFG